MRISLTPELERALHEEAAQQNKTPEQLVTEVLLAGLKNRRVPQSLDELGPRRPVPAGKTLKDVRDELRAWPGDETDAELLALLKTLDGV